MGIELIGVEKSWHKVPVLQQVSFRTAPGETLVLLGPSGAGKSSLLRMMNLLDTPDAGCCASRAVNFLSRPASPPPSSAVRLRPCAARWGMVFQQYNLWPHLTVMENLIEAPVKVLGMSREAAIDKGSLPAGPVAAGRQARCLAGTPLRWPAAAGGHRPYPDDGPQVLLFDEPTAAWTPEITKEVAEIIRTLSQTGITQVVVTHEVEFARKVASQVIYLEKGRIIESGTAAIFRSRKPAGLPNFDALILSR